MTRKLRGEFVGTAVLLFVIVGSGIMVERLSTDGAVQLVGHGIAVGAGLAVLIVMFLPVSGAQFNPAVTLAFYLHRSLAAASALAYLAVQIAGAVTGVVAANLAFGLSAATVSTTVRSGWPLALSEFVGTFILVLLIVGLVMTKRQAAIPAAVGAWVAAIIIATSSTGFANPAVTVGRMFTDTFTGIAPESVALFVAAQLAAGVAAAYVAIVLFNEPSSDSGGTSDPSRSSDE